MKTSQKPDPAIGQVWVDTYKYSKKYYRKRTVRIVELLGSDRVTAEIVTDMDGKRPEKTKHTRMSVKHLRTGYEIVGNS